MPRLLNMIAAVERPVTMLTHFLWQLLAERKTSCGFSAYDERGQITIKRHFAELPSFCDRVIGLRIFLGVPDPEMLTVVFMEPR